MYDISEEHVSFFFSRDSIFAKGVKRVTEGEGADVILDSLSGELLIHMGVHCPLQSIRRGGQAAYLCACNPPKFELFKYIAFDLAFIPRRDVLFTELTQYSDAFDKWRSGQGSRKEDDRSARCRNASDGP